jgi:hypothetical protein
VLRRSRNWLGLQTSWENLCSPAPPPGQTQALEAAKTVETAEARRERVKQEAIRGALGDERVVDEATFKASVRARELRAARDEEEEQRKEYCRTSSERIQETKPGESGPNDHQPKRWAQEDGKEYPITAERAELIVRWILDAPAPSASDGSGRPKKKSGARGKLRKMASTASSLRENGLEQSVESLDLVD